MHLFLSPHLDDAVLSCGGMIHHLVAQGHSITILTIMAGDPPKNLPDTPIVQDLHSRWQAGYHPAAARRKEDLAAAQRLGAKPIHLPIGDCVYRTLNNGDQSIALYPSEESLFGDVNPDDPAFTQLNALQLPPFEVVYVPMGVGHHVDHQLVRDWGLSLQQGNITLRLYEEYPYINDTMKIEQALTYYQDIPLQSEVIYLGEDDVQAKVDAIACYTSQISTFWSDTDEMARETRQSMIEKGNGRPAERFWMMQK